MSHQMRAGEQPLLVCYSCACVTKLHALVGFAVELGTSNQDHVPKPAWVQCLSIAQRIIMPNASPRNQECTFCHVYRNLATDAQASRIPDRKWW